MTTPEFSSISRTPALRRLPPPPTSASTTGSPVTEPARRLPPPYRTKASRSMEPTMRPDVFGDIGDLFWEVRGLRAAA